MFKRNVDTCGVGSQREDLAERSPEAIRLGVVEASMRRVEAVAALLGVATVDFLPTPSDVAHANEESAVAPNTAAAAGHAILAERGN
ncbi:MAG TPA: hypothetical protein VMR45_01305 [Patescibacteria group bacterium]|nr:hypothetical protein [Patescibacteria group bacterium]